MIDFEAKYWDLDIASFARWRKFFDICSTKHARELAMKQMTRIQSKYPTHIKMSEIPSVPSEYGR